MAANVTAVHGARGRRWLATLPRRLQRMKCRWSLSEGTPLPALSWSFVARVAYRGAPAALKLCVPGPEPQREATALRLFAGCGAARLLRRELREGALLVEWLSPGGPLVGTPGSATPAPSPAVLAAAAAAVMRSLWRPAPPASPLVPLAEWAGGFSALRARCAGGTGPLPAHLVARAEARLLAPAPALLLHGDLHGGNILQDGDGWRAIDPKGLVGPPGYDAATFLNELPRASREGVLPLLAESLGMAAGELREWCLAQAMLSAVWMLEDHGGGWEPFLERAAHQAALLEGGSYRTGRRSRGSW